MPQHQHLTQIIALKKKAKKKKQQERQQQMHELQHMPKPKTKAKKSKKKRKDRVEREEHSRNGSNTINCNGSNNNVTINNNVTVNLTTNSKHLCESRCTKNLGNMVAPFVSKSMSGSTLSPSQFNSQFANGFSLEDPSQKNSVVDDVSVLSCNKLSFLLMH